MTLVHLRWCRHFLQRETLSFDDWVSVLKLSTLWDFQDARRTAIDNLPVTDGDDPIARIELARIYKVPQWSLPALQMLATQGHRPVTAQDVERLGLQFSLNVAELQGKVKGFNRGRRPTCDFDLSSAQVCPVVKFIEELFPAAIMSGRGWGDSRPWDPITLSFLPIAEDPALTTIEPPRFGPSTPFSPASWVLSEVAKSPWPNDVPHQETTTSGSISSVRGRGKGRGRR
jgi:hypothetical protein